MSNFGVDLRMSLKEKFKQHNLPISKKIAELSRISVPGWAENLSFDP